MIPRPLKPYAKAVVAAGGVALLIFLHVADVEIPGIDDLVLELITGALVSFGVYRVRNVPHEAKK